MPEEKTPPVTQSISSEGTSVESVSTPSASTQSEVLKPGEVHVFGQHLMADLKLRIGTPKNDISNKESDKDCKVREIPSSDQSVSQEVERAVDDNSKQANPWTSKKSVEGPFTVKYPEGQLAGIAAQGVSGQPMSLFNGYQSDMGVYPGRLFDDMVEHTNTDFVGAGRNWAGDLGGCSHYASGDWWPNSWNSGQMANTSVSPLANKNAANDFRKLGLSDNQIIGLKNLGFYVPKFEPYANPGQAEDPRIPPSFELSGAQCWWCECAEHVSYGVARLLEDDPAVVGIDLEWKTSKNSTSYNKVALIQIAKPDMVLLIPTNSREHSAPKALHILFQDPKIVKVGVGVEGDLLKLWRDFQIDANSYTELNDLVPLSRFDFGIKPPEPNKWLGLEPMANLLGYPKWKNKEIACSNWENRPLCWDQLHYAALDALMGTRIFWRMLMGSQNAAVRHISSADLRANIETFVESVCRRVPISLLDKEQRIAKLKREGLYSGCSWERPLNSDVKNVTMSESHDRSSTTGGSTSGDSSGVMEESQAGVSNTRPDSGVKRGDSEPSCFLKGFGFHNKSTQRFGASCWSPVSKSDTTSELPLKGTHKSNNAWQSSAWKQENPSGKCVDGVKNWAGFHLPFNVATDLAN